MTSPSLRPSQDICNRDVIRERWAQLKKWGRQSLPDGTGYEGADWGAIAGRVDCNMAFGRGEGTWRHVLAEEFYEALAETEYGPLRAELVQIAAVAISWVEDLDARAAVPAVVPAPEAQLVGVGA